MDDFLNDWDMGYLDEPERECTCVEIWVDVDRTESFGPCYVHGGAR